MTEFGKDKTTQEEYKTTPADSTDDTSEKILTQIREGSAPVAALLQELLRNQQFISEGMNGLLLITSSLFLNRNDYHAMISSYISKVLSDTDPLYTLLMICINKASSLESKKLLHNWPTTFSMVMLSLLNNSGMQVQQDQVMLYMDKLGSEIFRNGASEKERWVGLYLVFTAKQQSLYQFLDKYSKHSWRMDLNFNLLCTLDNLLYEEDPDAYEVTMLKLCYYRGVL